MPIHLATVTMPAPSGIPADQMVNTWHFDGSGDFDNIIDMLSDFYSTVPSTGGSTTITGLMSNQAVDDEWAFRIYDLSDPMPRVPVEEQLRTMPGISSAEMMPREVALCMSYQAARLSGVNQARRRGRVYLGGLTEGINVSSRPNSTTTGLIAQKGEDLLSASIASVSWSWVVYSPTAGTAAPVASGWVDDAFDTQRRRGLAPTTRSTFP